MPARACRACLATDLRLYNIYEENLNGLLEEVIGIPIFETDDYPQYICAMCNAQLLRCNYFRNQVHFVQNLMEELKQNNIELTTSFIKTIDRKKCGLLPNLDTFTPPTSNLDLEELEIIEEPPEQLPHQPIDQPTETDLCTDQRSDPVDTGLDQEPVEPWSDDEIQSEPDTPAETYRPKTPVLSRNESKSYYENPEILEAFTREYNVDVVFLTKEQQIKDAHDRIQQALIIDYLHCTVCGKRCVNSDSLKKHKDLYHDEAIGVACEICTCRFSEAKLPGHMDTHRMLVTCRLCDFTTYGPHNIAQHARKHGTNPYDCKKCDATFLERRLLRAHVKENHPSQELWCRFCGDIASNKGLMRRHVHRFHKQIMESACFCSNCEVKFATKSALETHFMSTCEEFNCCVCGIHLETIESLKDHVLSSHRRHMKLEQCPGCGVKFYGVKSLKKHEESGCGSGRPCEECGETFPDANSLQVHKWDYHTTLIQACHICEIILPPRQYKEHMKNAHCIIPKRKKPVLSRSSTRIWSVQDGVVKSVRPADLERSDEPTETHICDICGKVYTNFRTFKQHRRAHLEKPYKCEFCGLNMFRKSNYENHIRLHNGEKPYQCPFCPKTFRIQPALSRHKKVHLNLRPHICHICGKTYRTSTCIKEHIRSVHLNLPARAKTRAPRQKRHQEHDADESQGHLDESQGHVDESQGHMDESQGHIDESQGHMKESQGHTNKRQGHMADEEQVNAVNSLLYLHGVIDADGFKDPETGLRIYPVKERMSRQTLIKPK